ncbi:phage antirepressor KilAC domain-containing protein [Clostridium neonatale]|uniref:phage antirepressor KilAC domain-containing protein n=1 Tax=Clostridium neonatale TaxID=137838 RepID=UPI00291B97B7|nr:anti-repressor protein [Clostridium neonatale]
MENDIKIFKEQQLIPLHNSESGDITLSGRELHEFLEVKTKYKDWFPRMIEYGFVENIDFIAMAQKRATVQGNQTTYIDHEIKLDMAKEIAMIQRNEKGKQARQYFIKVEKAWNSPEMIMKRALEIANKQVENLKLENEEKEQKLIEQQPKVIFADAVATSKTSILVGELAKILKQNGINIGGGRLFEWLRNNGYLIKRKGTDWNMPTQKSMELGLFEIKESTHLDSNGVNITTKTPKVTGKGQQYFINKFLQDEAIEEVACTKE